MNSKRTNCITSAILNQLSISDFHTKVLLFTVIPFSNNLHNTTDGTGPF